MVYPPAQPYSGSQNLHYYLGGGEEPFFRFDPAQLSGNPGNPEPDPPVFVIDGWGGVIQFLNRGVMSPARIDIWSMGPNGRTEVGSGKSDDIGNWEK